MSLESFYGGRIGASFIIVKAFDGIDIPQPIPNTTPLQYNYKVKSYAKTPDNEYFVVKNNQFVEKTAETFDQYENWGLAKLDGKSLNVEYPDGTHSEKATDVVLAEGMVQCFSQGGASTNDVNYGEYVIIDTPDKRNPDNGKVYRRGMNYITSAENPLAGAVYIGQIVGPQGPAPNLKMDHYNLIPEPRGQIAYTVSDGDITPGSYINSEGRQYIDKIFWRYATIRDEYNDVKEVVLGFKIPTLVLDFDAESFTPYYEEGTRLIIEDPSQYNPSTGKWTHSFYQKWKLRIPKGIHGINSTDIEVVHTKTKPKNYTTGYEGTWSYTDPSCDEEYKHILLTASYKVMLDEENQPYSPSDTPIYDAKSNSCRINYTSVSFPLYVKQEDCYVDQLRYKETNFDQYEEGRITYHYFGKYNNLNDVEVLSDGSIVLYFSAEEAPKTIEKAITWINSVTLSEQGNFHVEYNNDKIPAYDTELYWIDYVKIDDNGNVKFYRCSDHTMPRYEYQLKFPNNLSIETVAEGDTYEGTGDQKVHVLYSTGEAGTIGEPLNYIIEATISTKSLTFPNAPYSHLLVYYSDPALRQSMQDKWVRYPSTKVQDIDPQTGEPTGWHIWDEWVDLGNVKGAAGGIHILIDVPNVNELYDASHQAIPPEKLTDSQGQYIDENAAGWAVTVTPVGAEISTIFCYDYEDKIWYSIGSINVGAANPATVIVKSIPRENTHEPDPVDVSLLNEGGFWLASEQAYCVE